MCVEVKEEAKEEVEVKTEVEGMHTAVSTVHRTTEWNNLGQPSLPPVQFSVWRMTPHPRPTLNFVRVVSPRGFP